MGKGLFVTGTGTDTGKTYIAALMVKKLYEAGYHAGYYKAALSGAASIRSCPTCMNRRYLPTWHPGWRETLWIWKR